MPQDPPPPKASPWGAFFVCVILAGSCVLPSPARSAPCHAHRFDGEAQVARIHDGDTVRLQDSRILRLIGLNAPEMGRDGVAPEPFAEQATAALERLVPPGGWLRLRYDAERRDRYGRILAHAFLGNGDNVQRRMLETGMATALVVPPNLWRLPCYAEAESRARTRRAGLWSLARYQPVPAHRLTDNAQGFRFVSGTVQRVGQSRSNVWLNLTRRVAVRIPRADLKYFKAYAPTELDGKRVVARGWLSKRRGELRMTVRHPAALELLAAGREAAGIPMIDS